MRTAAGLIAAASILFTAVPSAAAGSGVSIGPDGGYVCALATAPSDPFVVYAGLQDGGVYRSSNGGATWSLASKGLGISIACSLAVDPVRPAAVWLVAAGRLFKTEDGGATWRSVARPVASEPVDQVAIAPGRPATVYATSDGGGVFKTRDGGATWTSLPGSPSGWYFTLLTVDPANPGTLYASSHGLYRSTDGGATWALLWDAADFDDAALAVAVDPRHPRRLYLSALSGFFRSADGGATWTPVPGPQQATSLAISPDSPSTIYAATYTQGIFRSPDGGASWQAARRGLSRSEATVVTATPRSVVAATADGAFASFDRGASWHAGRGMKAGTVMTLDLLARDRQPLRIYADTVYHGWLTTVDGGASWQHLGPRTPHHGYAGGLLAVVPGDPETLYLASNVFYRSLDGGRRWSSSVMPRCLYPQSLAVDPFDPATLYLQGAYPSAQGCFGACVFSKSTDAGETWTCLREHSSFLGLDPLTAGHVYADTGDGIEHSLDGGASWQPLAARISAPSGGLVFSPTVKGLVWGVSWKGVFRSTDGGATWEIHNDGLPSPETSRLAVDPSTPSTVYAMGQHSIYRSTDGGVTWNPLGTSLDPLFLWDLQVDPTDPSILYVATEGGGVLRLRR